MKNKYIIGVDIGGTNTDAVIVDIDYAVVAKIKTSTTSDIISGFNNAILAVLKSSSLQCEDIAAVHVGTTHAVNAILERRELYKVGVIRLAGHQPRMLPPCCGWEEDLKSTILAGFATVNGGFECDGRPITPLHPEEVKAAARDLAAKGAESLAIVGVFSPLRPEQETAAAAAIDVKLPITLSHELGGMGIVERENTAILNSALKKVMKKGFEDLQLASKQMGLYCPIYITQNNGSLITIDTAIEKPVLTLSAGPTNSFVGAARLAGLSHAIVVDIGGTSTDIGVVLNNFPRRSVGSTDLSGVSLNFAMPDVISIALGGGSHVSVQQDVRIGPQSVGHRLKHDSQSFGGKYLTFTDIAIRLGVPIPESQPSTQVTENEAQSVMDEAIKRIERNITIMQADKPDLPILLVGGGASLLTRQVLGERSLLPEHADAANAYGAALAQISGTVDIVLSLENREIALEEVRSQAIGLAVKNGACPQSTQIIDIQIMPYHYVPGKQARVVAMAAGHRRQVE